MSLDPAAIDALLASPKTLAGEPVWIADERGTVLKLAVPLIAQGGVGGVFLHAHATRFTDPQSGGCALVCEGRPIQRLSIRPDHPHRNPFSPSGPAALRGRSFPPGPSRLHAWSANRVWPRPSQDNVNFADLLAHEPADMSEALAIFLHICAIEGELPPPPWEPRLL